MTEREAPPGADPVADALAGAVADVAGDGTWAILLFGSRLVGTTPDPHSAWDLVLVVDAYGPFYGRLRASGRHRRSPSVLAGLSRVLPPNVVSFDPGLPGGQIAKVMVLTPRHLERALSRRAPDHFLRGRLVQRTEVLRARSPEVRRRLQAMLAAARGDVLDWTAPWLPDAFTAGELARRMLEVSYAGELRPESRGRVAAVFQAQRRFLEETFQTVLEEAERKGRVVRVGRDAGGGAVWRLSAAPGPRERLHWRVYFLASKMRATARWLKHVVTFDDWLAYIQRKVQRRTGLHVEVTPWERRLPLLLLWPKAFRVLRALGTSRPPPDAAGPGGLRNGVHAAGADEEEDR